MSETPHNLFEELYFQNNTATLFHRTRLKIEDVDKILKNGWSDSGSGHYGRGIYTTYKIEDQFDGVKDSYGLILLKFKYTALDKLLCFTPSVAKKVHPEGYSLKQQFEKLWPEHKSIDGIDGKIKHAQELVDEGRGSSAARSLYFTAGVRYNEHVAGIEYVGENDGHCVCIYPPAKDLILLAVLQTTPSQSLPDDPQWLPVKAAKQLWSKAFPSGFYTDLGVGASLSLSKGLTKSKVESLKSFFEKTVIRQRDVDEFIKDVGPVDAFNFIKKVSSSKVFGSERGLYLSVLFVPFANKMPLSELMEYVLNQNTRSVEEKLTFIKSVRNEIVDLKLTKYTDSLYKTYMTFIKSNNLVQNKSVDASAFLNTTLKTLADSRIVLSGDVCNDLIDTFNPQFTQPINRSSATVQDQVSALIFYRCELSKLHELMSKLSNAVSNRNDILISIEKKYEYYAPTTSSSDIQTRFVTVIDIFDGPQKNVLPVEFFDQLLAINTVGLGFNKILYTYLLQDKKAQLTTIQIHQLSRFIGSLITSEQYLDMAVKTLDTPTPLKITPDLLNGVLSSLDSNDDEKSWDNYVKLITTVTPSTNPVEFTVKHPLSAKSFLQFVRSLNQFNALDGKNLYSICSIGIESAYGKRDVFLTSIFPYLVGLKKIDNLITFRNLFSRQLASSDPGPIYTLLKDLHVLKPSIFNVLKTDPAYLGLLIKGTSTDRLGKYDADYSSGLYIVKYSLILDIIKVDDIPASILYDIIKNSSKYDYISLLELCVSSDNLLSQQFGYAREIIGLLVNSELFSNKVYDRVRNLNPLVFTSLTPERVLNMFGNRSNSTFHDPPHNPKATSSYLDILKTIKNNKPLIEELNKNSIYADAIIKFFQSGVRIADQNARDYLQYLVNFLSIFKTSLKSQQVSTLISIISYPATPEKKLWVGNTILSLFKKTNIDLNIIHPQSWAVLSNSSKVPKDIWKEALSPERKNSDEIFADIYALSSPKNKSELVKYAFSDFNFKFTPAVAVTLLESAETVETAKMIFDRSSIEKWDPGDSDLSAFFNGSIRYRNSGVQNYAYNVISKMFARMGRKEAVSFFSGIYEPKSVLFYVIKKRNLSLDDVNLLYNKMARILATRDDYDMDPRYSNAVDGLFKTILRYHSDKPELTAQFISNVANSDSLYNLLNYFKTIVKHFNGNIPYEIFKEMHRVMIDGLSKYGSVRSYTDTIITLTNLILKTNPSAVYVDNTATYIMDMLKSIGDNHYGYEDKVLKQVEEIYERLMRILRPRLSDRTAIELLSSYPSFSQKSDDLKERRKKIINYILSARRNSLTSPLLFNILNYSSRVGDDYFESMIGTLIDLQKNKLTRQDALEILRRANNKQMALDKLKDYIDNEWLKTIIGSIDPTLKLQETMVKYSDYFINESMTHGSQIDLQQAFDVFDASYKKSTGQSWDFNKFASRAQDWTFFGDDNGYVAVREQRSGMIKLVGTAGSPKSVIAGFREMTSHYSGKAVWGAVSLEIATMLERLDPNFKAMRVPGGMAGKLLFKALKTMIPANVFGGAQIKDVNADGTITFEYSDVGQANKVMVGNKEYFDFLKNQIATDPRLSSYAPMLSKLL